MTSPKHPCPKCGRPTRYNFCITCSNKARSGDKSPRWKGGVSKNKYHYKQIQVERYAAHINARKAVQRAVKSGRLKPQPCSHCGSDIVEAHHEDYSRPLDVVWYCRWYHRVVIHAGPMTAAWRSISQEE